MTLVFFEALLYLRRNWDFWDLQIVYDAIHASRSERVAARQQAGDKQNELT